jgi:hypothetical protein
LKDLRERYGLRFGGLYPAVAAFFIASTPSSGFSKGVVLIALMAPPADAASENAAALTLSGMSKTASLS